MDNYLWTDESVWCLCGHHIEYHISNGVSKETAEKIKAKYGWDYPYATCTYKWENEFKCDCYCDCKEFKPYKKKAK